MQLISRPLAPRRGRDRMEEIVRPSPSSDRGGAQPSEVRRGIDELSREADAATGAAERSPEELVAKIDSLVPPADEPENQVLVDQSRIVRWAGPLFALFSLILLPWTIYLGETLPARQLSPHYDIAWVGFDVILLIGLATTAYFALRRSRYLAVSAAATATLLVVDAWFDIMTTPGDQVAGSIALAAAVELPLAAVCLWLSLHTEQLAERRITLLLAHQRWSPRRRPTGGRRQR
jgi:hypothetical protein